MPAAIPCPTCHRTLKLPDALIGQRVQCPGCSATFTAELSEAAEALPAVTAAPPLPDAPPAKRKRERFLCPSCDCEVEPGMRRCPDCGERLDFGEEEDKPWERPGYQRLDTAPHRGGLVLTLGIIGLVVNSCMPIGFFFALPAWIMAQADLRGMKEGRIDSSGHGLTQAGQILGIIGTALGVLYLLGIMLLIVMVILDR